MESSVICIFTDSVYRVQYSKSSHVARLLPDIVWLQPQTQASSILEFLS